MRFLGLAFRFASIASPPFSRRLWRAFPVLALLNDAPRQTKARRLLARALLGRRAGREIDVRDGLLV